VGVTVKGGKDRREDKKREGWSIAGDFLKSKAGFGDASKMGKKRCT